jgi:hypothetical protein
MPIANKDLGKYRRPGIFIEEIDASIIEIPIQDVLINLVPGFSKKGPINKPVYITNRNDFESIFGPIDKQLERKGSYFHRTVIKMLESGPVWALNLLSLQDDRDKIQWVSVSLSSKYDNYGTDVQRTIPYSKIFNRQNFWELDDEAFLDYLKTLQSQWSNDRLLEMVNLDNKAMTVFLFESSAPGFDITAEDWYGGSDKVPQYINPSDWISDWMINVLIIRGDWTNYSQLSSDPQWSEYFNNNGLKKDSIQDFVNERNVTVLTSTDVSLIPYFTDMEGRDLYIKTVINNNSDKWKLFISYNEEKIMDSDFPIDAVDILGNNLITDRDTLTPGRNDVNFMSYKQSLTETINLDGKKLDSPGNTLANFEDEEDYVNGLDIGYSSRSTGEYSRWFVNDVTFDTAASGSTLIFVTGATSSDTIETTSAHGLSDGDPIYFNNTFSVIEKNKIYYVYYDALSMANNEFKLKEAPDPNNVLQPISGIEYTFSVPTMGISAYVEFEIGSEAFYVLDDKVEDLESETLILNPLVLAPNPTTNKEETDVLYYKKGDKSITVGTENDDFNEDVIILGLIKKTFTKSGTTIEENEFEIDYIPVSVNDTEFIPFEIDITSGGTAGSTDQAFMIIDFSENGGENDYTVWRKQMAFNLLAEQVQRGAATERFVLINLEDWTKWHVGSNYVLDQSKIAFTGLDTATDFYSGNTVFISHFIDNEFVISDSANTTRLLTTNDPVEDLLTDGITTATAAGVIGKHSSVYVNYYDGIIMNNDFFYQNNDPSQLTEIYMKFYMENNEITVSFVNSYGSSDPQPIVDWGSNYDRTIGIISKLGSLSQSIEVENESMYTDFSNITKIWVDRNRYPEVRLRTILERYVDSSSLELGQTPKRFVRVIRTSVDPNNENWKVVETDGPINVRKIMGEDWQTVMYSSIDDYVNEYKGLKLASFKMSQESIPNGTDQRQSQILNVIGKSTNLFKALVDKNKISWRYLIDSFGLGLNVSAYPGGSKQQYADLCGEKKNCLGFINMPSVRDFKNSNNPYFLDADGVFSTEKLLDGGDLDRNPPYLYEFARGVGRSTVGYFFPYVNQVDSAGIPITVPPASFVATTYMQKFLGVFAGVYPWTISAGINNGRVTGIGGTEMDFNTDDEENLYQMGANPILFRRNVGYVINSESTAQVFPVSSLSLMHSREVLIELENRMYDMLLQYQWRFNTPEVRAEIKYRADEICREIRENNGLYDFRNVMDETNNTDQIIDMNMGILDTYIEIIKGMSIIVNNITILRKGAIESGGFM